MKLKIIGKVIQTAPILHLLHQGEANADVLEMELPKRYEETDLSALQYTIYGVSEQDTLASQLLERSLSGEMVRLRWKVSKDFTAVGGKLSLWIAGVNSAGTTVIKFIGKPVEVSRNPGGEFAPPDFNAFEQALTRMQALLASAEQSERSASASKTAAAASEKAAAGSASTAAAKATAAETSANKAKTSETNSKASETAAKTSETNAAGSASTAAAKATAAEASANKAKTSETNAKTSETNSKASETAADKSRTDAQASANTAASEAGKAAASAAAAKASETGASQSAAAAKTSETAAGASASAAKASADTAAQKAETAVNAAVRQPVPKDDGFWYVWNTASNDYAKTEFPYQGPKGDTGTSFRVLGIYPTLEELTDKHPTGAENEAWAVGTEADNVIYLWDTDTLHWVNLGSIKGPPGKDGAKGEKGADGQSGQDGKSAYELAVENGFSGTEPQWLASLIGEKGADGIIGKDGKSAYQCAVGAGYTGTEAQFNAALSKAKDLSNVDNVKQYSADNPPPYPVTSVAGRTGAVALSKTDVGLSNVDNVKQSTATNLLNGSAQGSLRSVNSAAETASYKVGQNACAVGLNTRAQGTVAFAAGINTDAAGTGSCAVGTSTKATGNYSLSSGNDSESRGYASFAQGGSSIANGSYSIAEGFACFCDGMYSAYANGTSSIAASTQCVIPIASYSGDTLTVLNDGTVSYLSSAFPRIKANMEVLVWNTAYTYVSRMKYTVKSTDTTNYTITLDKNLPSSSFQAGWVAIPEIKNTTQNHPAFSMGRHSAAVGNSSFACGDRTLASGDCSFAAGARVKALGSNSAAFGMDTKATGVSSFAAGQLTESRGIYSTAVGYNSIALGNYSLAAGANSEARGHHSFAQGEDSIANGRNAVANGFCCFCDSNYGGYAAGLSAIAASTQCIIPIASYSGDTFTALNDSTVNYLISAFSKIKAGMEVLAWNSYFANPIWRKYTVKSVDTTNYTITLNETLQATSYRVTWVAIPEISVNTRYYPAISMGNHTAALGSNSFAAGEKTIASGDGSFTAGRGSIASGYYSMAVGNYTKALGSYSAAFGDGTAATGSASIAFGLSTQASGSYSTSFGMSTIASGGYSLAGGCYTIANSGQFVFGHSNVDCAAGAPSNTYGNAFILGNGTSASARSNCFRVQYDGQVFSKGNYSTTGADYAELFEWEDGNPDNEDRRGHFVALRGNKIHIAQPGEIAVGVISSTAAVIGNNPSETWQKMYLTDIWGDVLTEYKEFPAKFETIQHPAELGLDEDGNEVVLKEAWEETIETEPEFKGQVPVLNPDYNPDEKYIPRHERPEWGIVGLYGQLIVLDDGTCQVNGFCTCAEGGTATASSKGYLVIERLDGTHIRILSNFLNTQQQIDSVQAQQDEAAIDTDFRLLMLEMN